MNDHLRRDFLRFSAAGITGAALPPLASSSPARPAAAQDFNIRDYGATGDGKTIDSPAINRAIESATAAGGGTVHFPAGSYLCYSIHLKSNVALSLDQGATIIAADPISSGGYDAAEPQDPRFEPYQDFGHNHWHNSLIWGEGLDNVSIYGPGLIWGRGLSRGWGSGPIAENPGVANKAIALKNCRNVILRDFSILKAGHFGVLATGVDNLTIDNLKIDTDRDGIDIDCCRNVRVSNCAVNSPWDDAICPKSSFALGYARPTENLTISNCYVTGAYRLGSLLDGTFQKLAPGEVKHPIGRIKFGTESNGGFKNVTISNCLFESCFGLALETVDGALLEDFTITNLSMRDVTCPLFLRLGSRMRGPSGVSIGNLRCILISNLVCSNADPAFSSILSGIPGHPIEDVQLNDIYIQHRGGGTAADSQRQIAEEETKYPEPLMFGRAPCHGMFLRHLRNISVSNLEITSTTEDHRPAFQLDDVQQADFFRVRTASVTSVPTFVLRNVDNFSAFKCRNVADTQLQHASEEKL